MARYTAAFLAGLSAIALGACSTGTLQSERQGDMAGAGTGGSDTATQEVDGVTLSQSASEVPGSWDQSPSSAPQSSSGSLLRGSPTTDSSLSPTQSKFLDKLVINQLHHINMKEIELARLAQKKSRSTEIKSTARQILMDHQTLEAHVQSFAKSEGYTLSAFQPATHEKVVIDELGQLNGQQFDMAFSRVLLQSRLDALQQLRSYRDTVQNQQLTGIIDQALPKFSRHAEMAGMVDIDQPMPPAIPPAFNEAGEVGNEWEEVSE